MGLFSRSNTGSSSSSSQTKTKPRKGAKIPVQISETPDRQYSGNPEDMGAPAFVRTGSYYSTGMDKQPEYKYLSASDVRRQVRQAPTAANGRYPGRYGNKPPLPLQASPPFTEYPVVPSNQDGSANGNYVPKTGPGPVRAFYNNGNRHVFDVGYHDPNAAPTGPRAGSNDPRTPYKLATYREAPTYSEVRRAY